MWYPTAAPEMTPEASMDVGAAFGGVDGVVAGAQEAEAGEALMTQAKATPLSLALAQQLGDALRPWFPNLARDAQASRDESAGALRDLGAYVLDVKATASLVYFPSDQERYHMLYEGRARLVDTARGAIAWQDTCRLGENDRSGEFPTRLSLTAPDGAVYRALLDRYASACAGMLAHRFRSGS